MKLNSQIFFASLCLLFATPFLVVGGLEFPYQTTRIVTFSIAMIALLGAVIWRMAKDVNFRKKISVAASQPVVQIYGIFIAWLFIRSLPVFLSESWWGTWFRFDGLLFEVSFLCAIIAIAAWATEFEFSGMQKKLLVILGFIFAFSVIIFPALSLDRYVGLLPAGRFNGSVGNPLFLAGLLLFVPWFAGHFKQRYITSASTVIALGFLFVTDTRGAFIAACAGFVVYLWEYKKISQRIRIIIVGVVLIVGCSGVWAIAAGKISLTRNTTVATRAAMWKSGAQELMRQPIIGFGIGEHRNIIDRSSVGLSEASYGEHSDSTHSTYLDIALKGGLIALIIFIIWIIVLYRSISDENRGLTRATLVAYCVLLATAPWMPWTAIPLILLTALNLGHKKQSIRLESVFIGLCAIVIISSVDVVIVVIKNASYLSRVSTAMASQQFVALPEGVLITNKLMPFTKDFMIELLRLTIPTGSASVAPSYGVFIENKVLPVFKEVNTHQMHPDAYNVAATWASAYASSGLTSLYDEWFERSLSLQQRALLINPDRPAAVFQRADSLRELGRIAEAIESLKVFAALHPALPEARFYYGMMVDLSGDVRGAYEIEQQAKKDFPNYGWKESYQNWFADIEARAQKLPSK